MVPISHDTPWGIIKFILGFGILVYVVWLISGGYQRAQTEDPFLREPAPLDSGETYGLDDL